MCRSTPSSRFVRIERVSLCLSLVLLWISVLRCICGRIGVDETTWPVLLSNSLWSDTVHISIAFWLSSYQALNWSKERNWQNDSSLFHLSCLSFSFSSSSNSTDWNIMSHVHWTVSLQHTSLVSCMHPKWRHLNHAIPWSYKVCVWCVCHWWRQKDDGGHL